MRKLGKDRNELKVVFDQIGTPTYAEDLASVIYEIIELSSEKTENFKSGTYHYSNEGVCSWYDFAYEIHNLLNTNCKIYPVESSEFPTVARRPLRSQSGGAAKVYRHRGCLALH